MKTLKMTTPLIATLLGALATAASAATSTTNFQVTASVVSSCNINATNLSFGNYTMYQLDVTSFLSVTCTNGTTANIGLSAGTGTGATVLSRKMTMGSNTLSYALYQDSGRTINWGNTVGIDTESFIGTGNAQNFNVYGRIPAGQTSPVGSGYTDTIAVTVSY